MIVILGLVILVAAVVVGLAGVLTNSGSAHALTHNFTVLGYHVTGSAGKLFLYGIVIGALGLFGLSLLLAGARRTSRRGSAARRGLRQSRQETAAVSQARDELVDQRDAARAYAASPPANPVPRGDRPLSPPASRRSGLHLFGRRPAPRPAAATHSDPAAATHSDPAAATRSDPAAAETAPDVPADAPAPAG
jgi:hypothetical protein